MVIKHLTDALVTICFLMIIAGASAFAQSSGEDGLLSAAVVSVTAAERANTIGVVADEAGSTSLQITSELAAVSGDKVRLVPIAGLGPLQNLSDLMNLKGVDAAIVQTDVLEFARHQNIDSDIDKRLRFIARLYNREIHLISRIDQTDISGLNGKRVNIGPPGSGTAITAAAVFEATGVKVSATTYEHSEALHLLKTGQIDAMVYVGGKPVPFLQHLDPADGLKLLPVPFAATLQNHYRPGQFQHSDYRGLLPTGKSIETVSVGAAIVVFNWPKPSQGYDRLQHLAKALFDNISVLQAKPRHDKWRTVNLAAALPGWQRHGAAQAGLGRADAAASTSDPQIDRLRASFKAILQAMPDVAAAEQ